MLKFRRHSPHYGLLMTIPCDVDVPEFEKMELLAETMRAAGRPLLHSSRNLNCASTTSSFLQLKDARPADIESDIFEQLLNHTDVDTVLLAGDLSDGELITFAFRAFDLNFDVVIAEDAVRWGATHYEKGVKILRQSVAYVAKTQDIVAQREKVHTGETGYICFNDAVVADSLEDAINVSSVEVCLANCDVQDMCTQVTYDKRAGACSLSSEPVPVSEHIAETFSTTCRTTGGRRGPVFSHYWRYIDAASDTSFFTDDQPSLPPSGLAQ
eukprot:gnl/TRDRNA2_/TRDRNA2_160189_c1_seq2.p1 gnl/TRDRNA2_/TRDRNA2_160189_c1~~gnl/TRDRNA2_/TRDRNA2_160189_c1_seq2.p1  ORF type:complete len:269 (+),score=14.58 gnl/TRDRNA2_/TRDRNA2_160189_c1_seq2:2-808(+)